MRLLLDAFATASDSLRITGKSMLHPCKIALSIRPTPVQCQELGRSVCRDQTALHERTAFHCPSPVECKLPEQPPTVGKQVSSAQQPKDSANSRVQFDSAVLDDGVDNCTATEFRLKLSFKHGSQKKTSCLLTLLTCNGARFESWQLEIVFQFATRHFLGSLARGRSQSSSASLLR